MLSRESSAHREGDAASLIDHCVLQPVGQWQTVDPTGGVSLRGLRITGLAA